MTTNQPVNRLELMDRLYERLERAKAAEDEMMFLETWEVAWLLIPSMNSAAVDPDGTAQIAFNMAVEDNTQRHVPIQIMTAENYIRSLDCNAATQETEVE